MEAGIGGRIYTLDQGFGDLLLGLWQFHLSVKLNQYFVKLGSRWRSFALDSSVHYTIVFYGLTQRRFEGFLLDYKIGYVNRPHWFPSGMFRFVPPDSRYSHGPSDSNFLQIPPRSPLKKNLFRFTFNF